MASNLEAMASNLLAMASALVAMASNLREREGENRIFNNDECNSHMISLPFPLPHCLLLVYVDRLRWIISC